MNLADRGPRVLLLRVSFPSLHRRQMPAAALGLDRRSQTMGMVKKPRLHIVLVEPRIPQNTGNVSRTCAVTGAALHLVKPYGFTITDSQLKRAGLDYWDKLEIYEYDGLEDFFSKNDGDFYYFTTKGRRIHSQAGYDITKDTYLIFGREDKGLPEEMLFADPDRCVRIPMRASLRSLNLSNSVAIAVYEVLRQWDYPELDTKGQLTKYKWEDSGEELLNG